MTIPLSPVDAWNAAHPIGTHVRYWPGALGGEALDGVTRTPAQMLGHTPVVWLKGVPGCIALSHVEPIEEPSR